MPDTYKRLTPEIKRELTTHIRKRLRAEEEARSDCIEELLNSIHGTGTTAATAASIERTHRTLERIRDGEATAEEADVVRRAILHAKRHAKRIEDGNRNLHILIMRYLAEKTMTVAELAAAFNIDKSTVYRDIDAAIARLSVLM